MEIWVKTSKLTPSQSERFKEAARELGCDEDPAHFEEKLKKVAAQKPKEPPRELTVRRRNKE